MLDEEVIVRDGKKYAWTIPLAFPVDRGRWPRRSTPADRTRSTNERGEVVGTLDVQRRLPVGQGEVQRRASTARRADDHPGGRIANDRPADVPRRRRGHGAAAAEAPGVRRPRPVAAGDAGAVRARRASSASSPSRPATPCTAPTSTPWSLGLERLTREGHFAGAVLNPLVGETKGDDVDAATRMKTYRALIDNKALGQGDTDEELWKKVGRPFTDHVHAARAWTSRCSTPGRRRR